MTALFTFMCFWAIAWTGSKVDDVANELTAIRKPLEERDSDSP